MFDVNFISSAFMQLITSIIAAEKAIANLLLFR